jgi:hypothetical protein
LGRPLCPFDPFEQFRRPGTGDAVMNIAVIVLAIVVLLPVVVLPIILLFMSA